MGQQNQRVLILKQTRLFPGKTYTLNTGVYISKSEHISDDEKNFYPLDANRELLLIEFYRSEFLGEYVVKWLTIYGIGYNRKFLAEIYAKEIE